MTEARQREELSREDCLRLLGEAQVGRVVYTYRALPAVRPVSHLVEGERIIIRAGLGSAISPGPDLDAGTVVAYEADLIDAVELTGWSVVVVGRAGTVTGRAELDRYRRALRPWGAGEADDIIAIRADVVTGFRLLPRAGSPAAPGTRPAHDRID